jgi:putative transposase
MTTMDNKERAERRARQRELADRLKTSGALDQIFERIDAGEVPLGGDDGLLKGMLKGRFGAWPGGGADRPCGL